MKTKILTSIIAILGIALWICINAFQQTKGELATTQAELEASKEIWWKFSQIAFNWHNGIVVSIPDYYSTNLERPMVVKIDGYPDARYEFSRDGKSASLFRDNRKVEWTLKIPKKE